MYEYTLSLIKIDETDGNGMIYILFLINLICRAFILDKIIFLEDIVEQNSSVVL